MLTVLLIFVVTGIMSPKDIHILIPGTRECYFIRGFADIIKLIEMGRLFWVTWVALEVITVILIRGRLREIRHKKTVTTGKVLWCLLWRWRQGHEPRNTWNSALEAGKSKESFSSRDYRRSSALLTNLFCPVKLISDFWPPKL